MVHEGPARLFESEGDCARAVEARAYKAGDVLVIRNEGPVGGPGMQEMLGVTALIYGQQMGEAVALSHGCGLRCRARCSGQRPDEPLLPLRN